MIENIFLISVLVLGAFSISVVLVSTSVGFRSGVPPQTKLLTSISVSMVGDDIVCLPNCCSEPELPSVSIGSSDDSDN